MTDLDWIAVTVRYGFKKHVRRSRVASFGKYQPAHNSERETGYIEIDGRLVEVDETEAQLAALLGVDIRK